MGNTSNNTRLKIWIKVAMKEIDSPFTSQDMADKIFEMKGHRFSNRRVGSLLRGFAYYDTRRADWRKNQ